jgi:TPR repeat protein
LVIDPSGENCGETEYGSWTWRENCDCSGGNRRRLKICVRAQTVAPLYADCLQKGEGVSIDFKGAAQYFKLAADQGIADAQINHEI